MPRDEDKIIRLDHRREQEADRKRAEAKAKRDAIQRRRLAEQGPASVRTGRRIGQALAVFILLVALVCLGAWIWSLVR